MSNHYPSARRVRKDYLYNSDTGEFAPGAEHDVVDVRPGRACFFFTLFRSKAVPCHHLAWIHHYGRAPEGVIWHVNGDQDDNRIANLRETPLEFMFDFSPIPQWRRGDLGGLLGVHPQGDGWRVNFVIGGRLYGLGWHDKIEQANAVWRGAQWYRA